MEPKDIAEVGAGAGAGGIVGWLLGTRGKVTVKTIVVTEFPIEGRTPGLIACEETGIAIWIKGPEAMQMMRRVFGVEERVEMTYDEVNRRYTVVTPGRVEWNKEATSWPE